MSLEFILLLVAAYLFGSIPAAYLTVKWAYGVDIRRYGSGSVGASNVIRSFSKKAGIPVFFFDFGKGILMVFIARWLGMDIVQQGAVGIAVVVGHNWPIFLRFNAGRGVATTIGLILVLLPMGVPAFIFFALFSLIIGSSALPVMVAFASLPFVSWGLNEPLGLTLELGLIYLIMIVRRLTAPRSEGAGTVSTAELLKNRFLYDRDIAHDQAWIDSKPKKRGNQR
jgi:acyl phosphate:glycerol-3-phosphate acyltransferase